MITYIIEKIDRFKTNPENSFTTKVGKHIPSDFSMSTISSFESIGNNHDVYRGKDCMRKFCESLREHTMKKINFKKKKREVINKRATGIIRKCKNVNFCKQKFEYKHVKDKEYHKVRDHCAGELRDAAHRICNYILHIIIYY